MRAPAAHAPMSCVRAARAVTEADFKDEKHRQTQEPRPIRPRLLGCPGQDLNLHELPRYHLKVVRLPIPPPGRGMRNYNRFGIAVEGVAGAGSTRGTGRAMGRPG